MKHTTTPTAIRRQNFRQARILIIDNDADQLATMKRFMQVCLPEVEPIQASNEEETITYLNDCAHDEWKLPKLILLNVLMPRREEGWQILDHIKKLPAPANQIPVVTLSSSDEADDIREAYDRGSSSYLVKPSSDDEWLAHFQMLRAYWLETVTLPHGGYRC